MPSMKELGDQVTKIFLTNSQMIYFPQESTWFAAISELIQNKLGTHSKIIGTPNPWNIQNFPTTSQWPQKNKEYAVTQSSFKQTAI